MPREARGVKTIQGAPKEKPDTGPMTGKSGNSDRPPLEKIGALWVKKGKNGKYLSGVVNEQRIFVFPIKEEYRSSDSSPHYSIMTPAQAEKDDEIPF
jgi:hypothetical protein